MGHLWWMKKVVAVGDDAPGGDGTGNGGGGGGGTVISSTCPWNSSTSRVEMRAYTREQELCTEERRPGGAVRRVKARREDVGTERSGGAGLNLRRLSDDLCCAASVKASALAIFFSVKRLVYRKTMRFFRR